MQIIAMFLRQCPNEIACLLPLQEVQHLRPSQRRTSAGDAHFSVDARQASLPVRMMMQTFGSA